MKSALSVGAARAPEPQIATEATPATAGKARRIAGLSAAAAVIVGVGAASALFVDYLADRAMARTSDPVVVKPAVTDTVDITTQHKVASASLTAAEKAIPSTIPAAALLEAAPSAPAKPEPAPIIATLPDAAAIAKVAVGPEHAVELPTEDPTANPVVAKAAPAAAGEAAPTAVEDDTITAAIAPEEDEPAPTPAAKKKQSAEAKPAPKAEQTKQVASLPGVEVGEITDEANGSTVETVASQPAGKNLGGVPAGPARVTSAVKLRSGPNKGSGVLGVVPAGSTVSVMSCNGWCQIDHGGQKGWVYKNFLAAAQQLPPPAKPGETAENEPAKRVGQSPRL